MRDKISACITCGNEETNIRLCLESVKWCDEIVVVDSFSKDHTVAICKEYTEHVTQHEWMGYIGQKNYIKGLASSEWILFVDADEEVSVELRDEILGLFESNANKDINGYEFPRIVHFLGRWIQYGDWYPDVKLRLFRKARGTCTGKEPHDRVDVEGTVLRLKGHLHHFTYDNISDMVDTMDRFSGITSKGWYEAGRVFRWSDLAFRPFFRFVRCYFIKQGFRDGFLGLLIAVTAGYGTFIKYAKLREAYIRDALTAKTPENK